METATLDTGNWLPWLYIDILESACALRAHWILPSTAHSSLHLRCVYLRVLTRLMSSPQNTSAISHGQRNQLCIKAVGTPSFRVKAQQPRRVIDLSQHINACKDVAPTTKKNSENRKSACSGGKKSAPRKQHLKTASSSRKTRTLALWGKEASVF